MARKRPQRRDRYEVAGDVEAEYVDAEQMVLVNRQGITNLESLYKAEEAAVARAYEILFGQLRANVTITCELVRYIHQVMFGDLYEWAGRWRTVWISKPGTTWPPPDFIEQHMLAWERDVLQKYPAEALAEDEAFCRAAAEIQGEFLVIHPFREGNARTIKLVTDILAAITHRPLLKYDASEEGRLKYIAAAKGAFRKDYSAMAEIIRQALDAARRRS